MKASIRPGAVTASALLACLLGATVILQCLPAVAQSARPAPQPSPHAIDIPSWFTESFLDLRDDVKEAAARNKRLLIYFGQDGCPYCTALMRDNFGREDIADQTRRHFDAIALNIWGDREVTWIDGKTRSEKEFAAALKVQFTPTLLFLDEKGGVVLRANGYYPPQKFRAALDFASMKTASQAGFADYLRQVERAGSGPRRAQPFFAKPPYRLNRPSAPAGKPIAVLFEQRQCSECDELHAHGFKDREILALLDKFGVVRLDLSGGESLITPEGKTVTEEQWARALKVSYAPAWVLFDAGGKEVFRVEAYVKKYHLASSLDYVASGAYLKQPNFQRFAQDRADRMRARGVSVDLWK